MRIRAIRIAPVLLLVGIAAGCRSAARDPAPDPAPVAPPAGPMGIPSPPRVYPITVCLVENGDLREVPVTYNFLTGDTLRDGRPIHENEPTSTAYAAGAPWYIENALITRGEHRYMKYGTTRILASGELQEFGEYQGVPLFVDRGNAARPPEIIYVPVRPGCEFQRYVRELRLRGVRGE